MAKKKFSTSTEASENRLTCFTTTLDEGQMAKLRQWCDHRLWSFYTVEHALYAFKGDSVNIVAYKSGKVVIQGKKTEDFIRYVLEPEITGQANIGYDEVNHPEWFEAHAGLDESGKGDFFGPLVSATVIADGTMVQKWVKAGIRDSKRISGDAQIMAMEKIIRATPGVVVETTWAGMRRYNELYGKFGSNLNRLLAWMHSRSLRSALEKRSVPWGMLDQFSKAPLVQGYFRGTDFDLRMMPRAEADPVVAAASIIARAQYVREMEKLSERFGQPLLRGASAAVRQQGKAIVAKLGAEALGDFAKLHFRTAFEVLGLPVPEKKVWQRGGRDEAGEERGGAGPDE